MPSTNKPPCQKETDNACTSTLSFDSFTFCFLGCLMIPWILTTRVGWTGGCLEERPCSRSQCELDLQHIYSLCTLRCIKQISIILRLDIVKSYMYIIALTKMCFVTFNLDAIVDTYVVGGAISGHLDHSPCQPSSVSRHGIDSQELRLRRAH